MWSLPKHPNCYKKKCHVFLSYKKEKMPSLSTKERKTKLCTVIKEFHDKLLNLVKIQDKMDKNYPFNEQQATEIDELYDEIWEFDKPIKNLEILLAKNNVEKERVNRDHKRKVKQVKSKIRMQARLNYARRI